MRYEFPANITLEEVRAAVASANTRAGTKVVIDEDGTERTVTPKVFIEAERDDHVIFNYLVAFEGTFPWPGTGDAATDREYAILRECRGMTFHKDGRLLNRKFAKFFNLGEKPESQLHVIDFSEPHMILEKLDGSMITPLYLGAMDDIAPEKLRWATKMGLTDVAAPVEAWVAEHPHYARWASQTLYAGFTPLFEWCSRKQRIVIDYPEDRLVLTAIRNNATGQYLPYSALEAAGRSDIEFVRALPGSVENIEQFMAETYDLEGAEGYIIRFSDGRMYKVKGLWYCQIHKTKELLQFEKDVLALVASDRLDDAKAFMDEGDKASVESYYEAYEAAVAAAGAKLFSTLDGLRVAAAGDRKAFAESVKSYTDATLSKDELSLTKKLLFAIKDGDASEAVAAIRTTVAKYAHPTAGTQTRVNAIRFLLGGLRWETFRDQPLLDE
jgi:T4 RnlA family RNA ligase